MTKNEFFQIYSIEKKENGEINVYQNDLLIAEMMDFRGIDIGIVPHKIHTAYNEIEITAIIRIFENKNNFDIALKIMNKSAMLLNRLNDTNHELSFLKNILLNVNGDGYKYDKHFEKKKNILTKEQEDELWLKHYREQTIREQEQPRRYKRNQ